MVKYQQPVDNALLLKYNLLKSSKRQNHPGDKLAVSLQLTTFNKTEVYVACKKRSTEIFNIMSCKPCKIQ